MHPSWSPHGHRIAYATRFPGEKMGESAGEAKLDTRTIPSGGGEETAVTDDDANDWSPAWSADGRHLVFSNIVTTTWNAQKATFEPGTGRVGEGTWVTRGTRRWANPDPSPDGSDNRQVTEGDIWLVTLRRSPS